MKVSDPKCYRYVDFKKATAWQANGCVTLSPAIGQVTVTHSGYILMYIDNQSIGNDVWFDNVHLEHYTGQVLEEDMYYPFGLTISQDAGVVATAQPYKYNSKELQAEFDLQYYDYGARMYNSQIGRWNGIDELAEGYYSQSPFNYVGNNPIRRIDIEGKDWLDILAGVATSTLDNATGINLRNSYTPNDADDYNFGQDAGDAGSYLAGSIESGAGLGIVDASVVVTGASGGLAIEVTAPAAVAGTAMTAHGAMTAANALESYQSRKGRT